MPGWAQVEHIYQNYPKAADDTLKKIECVWPIADIVLQHRECYDGSGFPRGIQGEEMLIQARILSFSVALEVLMTHRRLRKAFPLSKASESESRQDRFFVGFNPAISNKAAKSIRDTMRQWQIHRHTDTSLDDLAKMSNPVLRGWINYYGSFNKSALYLVLRHLNSILVRWATRKYNKLRGHHQDCCKRRVSDPSSRFYDHGEEERFEKRKN